MCMSKLTIWLLFFFNAIHVLVFLYFRWILGTYVIMDFFWNELIIIIIIIQ